MTLCVAAVFLILGSSVVQGLEFKTGLSAAAQEDESDYASQSRLVLQNMPKTGRSPASESEPAFMPAVAQAGLIVTPQGFLPQVLVGTQGVPLKLYITSTQAQKPLCFVLEDPKLLGKLQPAIHLSVGIGRVQEIKFTPMKAGTFSFSCPALESHAKGVFIIRERATDGSL
jgi:hypothetical protein